MAEEFNSRIFTLDFLEGEELTTFKNDAILLSKIAKENWSKIIPELKKGFLAKTEKEESAIREKMFTEGLIPNRQSYISFKRMMAYFLKKFTDKKTKEDTTEIITEDFKKILGSIDLGSITNFLKILKSESNWYDSYSTKKSYDKGLFPFLKKMGTTVELRGVFNRELEYGESAEDYSKELKIDENNPVVPIISVALTMDIGTPDRFCFQATPEAIKWLIEELKASLSKAELLENNFRK